MTEHANAAANTDQAEFWNSGSGQKWVDFQDPIDAAFRPVADRLLEIADPKPGERVIDIGCGTGATARDVAARVGTAGRVLGVDISRVLLAGAERRSVGIGNIDHLLADAQTHAFEAGAADLLISRFGVMFFDDPVAAFRNMGRALRPGGRLAFVAWTPLAENPWFTISLEVAVARLGPPPPAAEHAPGPFAFADADRTLKILRDAGWADCTRRAERIEISTGALDHAARLAGNMGSAARLMKHYGGGPEDAQAIDEAVRARLEAFVVDGEVRMPVHVNFFEAVQPGA